MGSSQTIIFGQPEAVAHDFPWRDPPSTPNPPMRGLALSVGATLCVIIVTESTGVSKATTDTIFRLNKSNLIQGIFWSSANFGQLRDRPELDHILPRYDPTVIVADGSAIATPSQLNSTLLAENWQSKTPSQKTQWSILDYHEAYKSGRLTPTTVAERLIPLIQKSSSPNSRHSIAFAESHPDEILVAAAESTERYRTGTPLSPLDGVPVAVKEQTDIKGYKTTFSSAIDLTPKDAKTSNEVTAMRAAGAVVVGKTIMHEFGCDITNNNPVHGTPRNPNNEDYYTGGSTGGSAYAVAAGLVPLAQGNDGGGSIRIPSNYCGIYGLKTSHSRVTSYPTPNLAASTGVSGPMAANMVDLEIGYRIMAHPVSADPTSRLFRPPGIIFPSTSTPTPLGIYRPWFDRADTIVRTTCQSAIDHLVSTGTYTLVDITLPLLPEGQISHAISILSEISSAVTLSDISQLSAPNKIFLSLARQHSAIDLLQAMKVRTILMQHLAHLFKLHPGLIIITPTTPEAGWRIENGDLSHGLLHANKQLRNMEYVWMANFTGCPALTAPVGYAEPEEAARDRGMIPVGIMGMAEWCCDERLIEFGYDCERYLHEKVAGGRRRPKNWEDLLV